MRSLARVLVDESHRQAWSTRPEVAAAINPGNPADDGYVKAAQTLTNRGLGVAVHVDGAISAETLLGVDVLVLPHCSTDDWEATIGVGSPVYSTSEIDAIDAFVRGGGGLVILAETEQSKYGNSLAEIAARFGVVIENATVQDSVARFNDVPTWVLAQPADTAVWDVWAGVRQACLYRAGVLHMDSESTDTGVIVARSSATASPPNAGLVAAVEAGSGRVVVVTDSDVFGDDSIDDLDNRTFWRNLVTWSAAGPMAHEAVEQAESAATDAAWAQLVAAVEDLRPLQEKNGSVPPANKAAATVAVGQIVAAVEALAPRFPHQSDQLAANVADFRNWLDGGLEVPDFLDSLMLFRPEESRANGVEHLAVFPMYTQNGNPNRNVEAVITRTVWPEWIAELEAGAYDNHAFVPIEFVAFTAGYDTHSAVLFPETVAVRETPKFTWGGIFCDREAARFRAVTRSAAGIVKLALPPAAEMLVNDQRLTQETFVLWDLVHDRTHSHGDLPFDPFMIKQRMPYWMYALEELRCDLNTYRETAILEDKGVTLAPQVRYAILFDRLFRFPTTGSRVRNYDGLGGQILFAWLHKNGVLNWTDNTLSIDWLTVDASVVELCELVNALYREGIDRSRIGYWLAAHEFVRGLVPAHPASVWARGGEAIPAERKDAVDAVLDDEFPLNVFYEALSKNLAGTIESTKGITGAAA
ncbi:MAG: DUF6421 family protein [Candidatus Nanopelagicales bacterium]